MRSARYINTEEVQWLTSLYVIFFVILNITSLRAYIGVELNQKRIRDRIDIANAE